MAAGRATALLALCALGVQGELHAGRAPALGGARTAWPAPLGSARAARPKARPLCLRARGGELAIARDILIISTLIIALLVAQAVQIVGTNEELLVERLGKFHRRLGPGLHFVLPGWERIAFSATLREQVLDVPPQQCITRDNAPLTADAVIYFRVIDSYATRYAVEDHIDALSNLVLTQLRNEIGQLTLDQTFGARAELNRLLMVGLEEVAAGWGLRVTRIEVKDITPSPDILSAMEMQMAAERKKRALVLESEGEQQSRVNRAEGDKCAAVLAAQAEREATLLRAEAEAEAVRREARGLREAVEHLAAGSLGGDAGDTAGAAGAAARLLLARGTLRAQEAVGTSSASKVLILPAALAPAVGAAVEAFASPLAAK